MGCTVLRLDALFQDLALLLHVLAPDGVQRDLRPVLGVPVHDASRSPTREAEVESGPAACKKQVELPLGVKERSSNRRTNVCRKAGSGSRKRTLYRTHAEIGILPTVETERRASVVAAGDPRWRPHFLRRPTRPFGRGGTSSPRNLQRVQNVRRIRESHDYSLNYPSALTLPACMRAGLMMTTALSILTMTRRRRM